MQYSAMVPIPTGDQPMRALAITLAFLLTASVVSSQAASFTSVTKPCPSSNGALYVTGLPKLGGSFTVSRIMYPGLCTRRYCGCNVGKCNTCRGSVLLLGVAQINIPLPGGCSMHCSPDFIIFGGTTIAVPNNPTLSGFVFYMQRMDLGLDEMITSTCGKAYVPTAFMGFSDLVKGTVGN